MCVIIVKDKGVKMPSMNTLKLAFDHNPNGIGVVSSGGLYWRGLDFNEFKRKIRGVSKDESCIIHFRLATHGSPKVGNCHPFRHGSLFFAHNGVLPVRTTNDMTDSETVFRRYLVPAYEAYGFESPFFDKAVWDHIHTSKFAFMENGLIRLFGKFYQEDGVYYSNFYFRPFGYYYTPGR